MDTSGVLSTAALELSTLEKINCILQVPGFLGW